MEDIFDELATIANHIMVTKCTDGYMASIMLINDPGDLTQSGNTPIEALTKLRNTAKEFGFL